MKIHRYITESSVNVPKYLYHATYKPFLNSIKKKGLGNTNKKMYTDSKGKGTVYLALDPDVAISYAETAEWLDDVDDYDKYADNIIVLKIDTQSLNQSNFYIDDNVIDNEGDTIEYHGIIPFSSVVDIIKDE